MGKIESSKWFQAAKQEKTKVKRAEVPASYLQRLLNYNNVEDTRRYARSLHCGVIGSLDSEQAFYDALVNFWEPQYSELDYKKDFYLNIGTMLGEMFAERLHRVPGLTTCISKDYKEERIQNDEFGYAGYIDFIMDVNTVKHYGKKTRPEDLPETKDLRVFEMKTTGERNYNKWVDSSELSFKYRCQLSLYIQDQLEKEVVETENGFFILQSRDDPNKHRVMPYTMESTVISKAQEVCTKFWDHVDARTLPSGDDIKPVEGFCISKAIDNCNEKGREWPKYFGWTKKDFIK